MIEAADVASLIPDGQFKDSSPTATVERIQAILSSHGIEVKEHWRETCVPYCHAVSIRVVGTNFSVNGKGLTREFARASGYGELMERMQLGSVGKASGQRDAGKVFGSDLLVKIPAGELYRRNEKWYQKMAQRLRHFTGTAIPAMQLITQHADADGAVQCMPFYCMTTNTMEHFPNILRARVYTTNGCAAGNSAEETLVQGISEIVERYYMTKIVHEGICPPTVPEDVLRQYKASYDIISYIRAQGFKVSVKDCSLGERFPVVCVCMIDEKTGRYHTHFGAYPIFEIALERALTESFQGRPLRKAARFEDFLYKKQGAFSFVSLSNEFTQGGWNKMPDFFVGEPQYAYNPNAGFDGANNKELLRQCVEFFTGQGYDILLRDCSCLGFYTYQILIPGYSEAFLNRLYEKTDDRRYFMYAAKTLSDPSSATLQEMLGLLMHMEEKKKITKNNTGIHNFLAMAYLTADLTPEEEDRLLSASVAYVHYALGQYQNALAYVDAMIPGSRSEDTAYLICLKRYLSMVKSGYRQEEIRKTLEYFHDEKTVGLLYSYIERKANPLEHLTLHCHMQCDHRCRLYGVCHQKQIAALTDLLNEKQNALDTAAFVNEIRSLTE